MSVCDFTMFNILSCNIYRYKIPREKRLRVEPLDEIHELHHQSRGSPSIVQGAIMDIQKRVAVSVIQRIHFTLPRLLCAHLSPRRSLSFSRASSTSSPILPSPIRPSRESTYGCSFGNHIFFVSQFAAPLNALPPFRRGCISVAAARYKFWRRQRALDGVGEGTRKDGERRGGGE